MILKTNTFFGLLILCLSSSEAIEIKVATYKEKVATYEINSSEKIIDLKTKIKKVEKLSINNNKIQINMALNYGSRQEILNSVKIIKEKKLSANKKNFEKYLYTNGIPDPDILIRTGDTQRISNFLILQLVYTEIFFVKKMWPDFTKKDFFKIIDKFKNISRNFGGLNGGVK